MPIITVKNLTKTYMIGKQSVSALKEVDLSIEKGEFISIAGPSGSGKTTLLNLIGCLDKPTSGEISIENEDVFKLNMRKLTYLRREKIGFIFQFFNLLPVLNVYENVEYPLILHRLQKKERKKKIFMLLEQVGLKKYYKHRPNELSGGQQQRVAIARALVINPVIVLADEPTGNLDSQTANEIICLMKNLNKESNTTFLFSTHDPEVMKQASRLVNLHDGQIV